ncbi:MULTISPECIES: class II fumarate hydratase [Metallosphaera]|uniref:class II fumarate hydratase n=1 Tax=Metallosphaera TaxID=41980 RepID=UPI001F05DDD0|nr:class II fumarate hydratase [Metallosphaera sedula]MCH1770157.1 class II fumarate hydratase [Metallosphaera sedula]MCP6728009.1 class II fumarate hydratase [Metallosphaera sedula]
MKYTESAPKLFMNTGTKFHRSLIFAMGVVKYSCARANATLGILDQQIGKAIEQASMELMEGKLDDKIVLDVFQTGSGTGLNMNVNEVLAERASQISGLKVHPNDHVNMSQSSNDTVPTAIRIGAVKQVQDKLIPALEGIISSLRETGDKYSSVIKSGRTHLRDAMPVTLGQELHAYADALSHDLNMLKTVLEYVKEIPLGGTAVGTGVNSHPKFRETVITVINQVTGLGFTLANPFRGLRFLTDLLTLSGIMRTIAVELYRMAQDFRLMFSGPMTAIGEIDLPTQEEIAGSSIMPGKTNPVTAEASMLIAAQVVGLDQANQFASNLGEFELAMGVPLIGQNVVTQVDLLSEGLNKFSSLLVKGMVPNQEKMKRYAESSPALVTVISPIVGYDKASQIGKMLNRGMSIREALKELGFSDKQIDDILDLSKLVKPGIQTK